MKPTTHRCVYCGQSLPWEGPRVFSLRIGRRGDSQVCLRWCASCAEVDPLQLRCAEADAADDDDAFSSAYLAIVDRVRAEAPGELQSRINVRRDTNLPGLTLRGPGELWGRLSERKR